MNGDGSNRIWIELGMDLVSDRTGYSYYGEWQPAP
jgi:hypothetical protein